MLHYAHDDFYEKKGDGYRMKPSNEGRLSKMKELGNKIAEKRKNIGMTQTEFADEMCVTRQTVSRWEAGTVLPDIDKIVDIASILGVSTDYLLKDGVSEDTPIVVRKIGKILQGVQGKKVKLSFCDGEADIDRFNTACRVLEFEGNWLKISADTKKGHIEKLIPVSSVLSIEVVKEAE